MQGISFFPLTSTIILCFGSLLCSQFSVNLFTSPLFSFLFSVNCLVSSLLGLSLLVIVVSVSGFSGWVGVGMDVELELSEAVVALPVFSVSVFLKRLLHIRLLRLLDFFHRKHAVLLLKTKTAALLAHSLRIALRPGLRLLGLLSVGFTLHPVGTDLPL